MGICLGEVSFQFTSLGRPQRITSHDISFFDILWDQKSLKSAEIEDFDKRKPGLIVNPKIKTENICLGEVSFQFTSLGRPQRITSHDISFFDILWDQKSRNQQK